MEIAALMRRRVIAVEMDDDLSLARTLLEQANIHHLPVVDEAHRVVGILSDRDVLRWLSPFLGTPSETRRDQALLRKPVHQIMTRHPITVGPDESADIAARYMLFNQISSLPVVDGDDTLLGILTWKDLLCHYTRQPAHAAALPRRDAAA